MSKSDRITPAEEQVLERAVQFIECEAAQQDLRDLRAAETINPRTADFLKLAEAVEALRKKSGRK